MRKLLLKISNKAEEALLLNESTIKKPGRLFQILNKFPLGLYKVGLGALVVGPFLRITTIGRISGLPRHTMLEYIPDPASKDPIIMSGWGDKSDWVKNILKNPTVTVCMRSKSFNTIAERLSDEEVANRLEDFFKNMPRMRHVLETRVGFKLDGTRETLLKMASLHPTFRLRRE